MKSCFDAEYEDILANPDPFIDGVFATLESEFMVLPRGPGLLDYPDFENAYEALKQATNGFSSLQPSAVLALVEQVPVALIVLRTMLGFTPPEWAYVARQRTRTPVTQSYARTLDREVRLKPQTALTLSGVHQQRVHALVAVACELLKEGAPDVNKEGLHRLDKADTRLGLQSVVSAAKLGVPYAMLLYERFLGRPFAGHRDSVSEIVGDALETAVEDRLAAAGISYRKTRRAERIQGFDQAPDFFIPSEFNPAVVIEAKLTEDDGTARDKVTRIQHLAEIARRRGTDNRPAFQVVACIAGRGFSVRREDMKKLLISTRGKVFTLKTLDALVTATRLQDYTCTKEVAA